jgi:hypothetical protein
VQALTPQGGTPLYAAIRAAADSMRPGSGTGRPHRSQRVEIQFDAPAQEHSQVGLGVEAGLPTVAAQVGGHRRAQNELIGTRNVGMGAGTTAVHHRASPATLNASAPGAAVEHALID